MPPLDNSPDTGSPTNAGQSLPADIKRLVDESVGVDLDLLRAYQYIAQDAALGKVVRGHDFTDQESRLNDRQNDIEAKLAKALADGDIAQDSLKAEATAFGENAARAVPDLLQAFRTDALDRAFAREYLASAQRAKNTRLNPTTTTESAFVADLLSANKGFALGENHLQDECCTFLARNMGTFKAHGVDTIYMESQALQRVKGFSPAELRQLARDGHYQHVRLPSAKDQAETYNSARSDNVLCEEIKMLAAAKENGIRLVYIDKRAGLARDAETMGHRIASTNFVWTDIINADRGMLAKKSHPEGKYIVVGGLGHFICNKFSMNGMVDKALGIPVIAYERADKQGPAFKRATNPDRKS